MRRDGLASNVMQTLTNVPVVTTALKQIKFVRTFRGPTGVYVRQGITKPRPTTAQVCDSFYFVSFLIKNYFYML